MKPVLILFALALTGLAGSCATDNGTKPDDMSAEEHRAAARAEDAAARKHEGMPEPRSPSPALTRAGETPYWDEDLYSPSHVHENMAEQHRTLAHQHEAAAQTLDTFEQEQCASFPPATRHACPLLGPITSTEDIDGGVRLHIADGVPLDAVEAHVRCHFAFARAQGYQGMDACPLYLKGVRVERGDGTLDLLVDDPALVDELRKRAANHVYPDLG